MSPTFDPTKNEYSRVAVNAKGIRFLIQTKGVGRSFMTDAIVLQSSLGTALTKMSIIVVDFLMLYVVKSKKTYEIYGFFIDRKKYQVEKFSKTEDFSELEQRKQADEDKKERKRIRELRKQQERLKKTDEKAQDSDDF